MKLISKNIWVYIILLCVLFLAFPLLFFFERKMLWDLLLLNLPWRYQLSESINNGCLPLWNPYINNGYPQMGQYETWYPVSWVIALLFKYDLQVLQYEYLFNLLMAGIGFYKLSTLIEDLSIKIKLSGAIAYMLCGLFLAQSSHFGYITAGTWMTFVFYFLIKFLVKPNWKDGFNLVFFYFLLMTGGYPGNTITITYMCIIIFILFFIKKIKNNDFEGLKKMGVIIPVLSIVFLSVYGVVLYSTLDFFKEASRQSLTYYNEGQLYATSGSNSFASYLSLIVPSVTAVENDIWQTYEMVNSSYIGFLFSILPIFYLLYGKRHKYYKKGVILIVVALFFMTVSLAIELPLHKLLYHIVPLFDRFRFPSLFRIFFMLNFILVSLLCLDLLKQSDSLKLKLRCWLLVLFLLTVVGLFFTNRVDLNAVLSNYDETIKALTIKEMLHLDLWIIIVLSSIYIIIISTKTKWFITTVLMLTVVDVLLHAWIIKPIFVSNNTNPKLIDEILEKIPDGYPLINQTIAIKNVSTIIEKNTPPMWHNRYAYHKYPYYKGSNPFRTQSFLKAHKNGDFETLSNYPFLAIFSNFTESKVDSIFYKPELSTRIISTFTSPNEFDFLVNNSKGNYVLFNQNKSEHWHFYENEKKLIPIVVSTNYLAVKLQSNQSILKIKFENSVVSKLFFIAVVGFFALIILLLYFNFFYKPKK